MRLFAICPICSFKVDIGRSSEALVRQDFPESIEFSCSNSYCLKKSVISSDDIEATPEGLLGGGLVGGGIVGSLLGPPGIILGVAAGSVLGKFFLDKDEQRVMNFNSSPGLGWRRALGRR